MNKKFLIIGVIIVILLAVGGVFYIKSKKVTNTKSVLADQTQNTTTDATPVLEIFSGNVFIKTSTASDFSGATNEEKVNVGDVIKTDATGRAQVLYPTHSVTRIDFNSQMTIEEYTANPSVTKVKVDEGNIWSRVAKLFGANDSNDTENDTLVASVRGTSYGLGSDTNGNTIVEIIKSHVYVQCDADANKNFDLQTNNKITTKCLNNLTYTKLTTADLNSDWVKFNSDQDKILDARFPGSFDDEPTPTPTPKPTLKPIVKPTASPTPTPTSTTTSSPTSTPTATPTPTSTPTYTPTPSPTPSFTVNSASCGDCDTQTNAAVSISGSGFIIRNPSLQVYAINTATGAKVTASSAAAANSTVINANFSSINNGKYYVGVVQNGTTVENKNATFVINEEIIR